MSVNEIKVLLCVGSWCFLLFFSTVVRFRYGIKILKVYRGDMTVLSVPFGLTVIVVLFNCLFLDNVAVCLHEILFM